MGSLLFSHWTVSLPLAVLLGIAAGAVIGLIHFLSLKLNTRFYLEGSHGKALVLHLGRFAILIVTLGVLSKFGAVALLTGMVGILAARGIILRRERRVE